MTMPVTDGAPEPVVALTVYGRVLRTLWKVFPSQVWRGTMVVVVAVATHVLPPKIPARITPEIV